MKKFIPFLIAAGVGLFFWAKSSAVHLLKYYVDGVSANIVNGYPVITLNIAVQNPSNEQFTIKSVIGVLTANGQPIGNVQSNAEVVIKPASQSDYPINVRVKLEGIVLTVFNLITQGIGGAQTLGFSGDINASGVVAPVDIVLSIA